MKLECASGIVYNDATAANVNCVFDNDELRGEFVILLADNGDYIQAAGEFNEPFVLEYHVGASDEHFYAERKTSKQHVREAFLMFLDGDASWRDAQDWKPLERRGCRRSVQGTLALSIVAWGAWCVLT